MPARTRPRTTARYTARARVIKAMAHPSRLLIIDELNRGERCVCELTDLVGDDTSTVSKHLSVLKNAGIVEDDRRGAKVFYHLRVPCILDFFGCVERLLERVAEDSLLAASKTRIRRR